ncbi:MAG: hypothetical protein V4685_10130 [Bacteroidota bacterium]
MRVKLLLLICLSVYVLSCDQTDTKLNYSNSDVVAFNLIKTCVDTLQAIRPEINTANYVLDLSSISTLNKKGVDSFLHLKNKTLPTTLDDSTMIADDEYGNYHMKQSMILKIYHIEMKNADTAIATIAKMRSSIRNVKADIILRRHLDGYQIVGMKIENGFIHY